MKIQNLTSRRLWNSILSTGDKLLGRSKMMARPMRIHLEINDFCNLKCPHCPRENPDIPKNTGYIPLEAVKNLEPWFRTANYVGLAGNGEPFLHRDIIEILEIIINAGAAPSIISNATLWKKYGIVDKLAGMGPMILNVSLDGGTKETFEKWRKKASFEEVKANLLELRQAKEAKGTPFPIVNFITCLMKDTLPETPEIIDWAYEAGASVVVFQNMMPYNKFLADQCCDPAEARESIRKARQRSRELGNSIRVDWIPLNTDVDDRGSEGGSYGRFTAEDAEKDRQNGNGNGKALPNGKKQYHCDAVWHQVHVNVKGEIKFCCFWTEGSVGDITKDDIGSLWNGEEWQKLRRDIKAGKKPKPCQNCYNLVERDRKKILKGGMMDIKDLVNR